MIDKILVFFDGSGPHHIDGKPVVGCGIYIVNAETGEEIHSGSIPVFVEKSTNVVAEIMAATLALKSAVNIQAKNVSVFGDNEYAIDAFMGRSAVRLPHLSPIFIDAQPALIEIKSRSSITFSWIPRKENTIADRLSKSAISNLKAGVSSMKLFFNSAQ